MAARSLKHRGKEVTEIRESFFSVLSVPLCFHLHCWLPIDRQRHVNTKPTQLTPSRTGEFVSHQARVEIETRRTGAKKNPTWYFYQAGLYFEIRFSRLVVRTNPFGRASLILSFRAH